MQLLKKKQMCPENYILHFFPLDTPQQQQQQYVPPSEQQAPEPKKYTGSAIPSRSFKILQAMTTPENAGKYSCGKELRVPKTTLGRGNRFLTLSYKF